MKISFTKPDPNIGESGKVVITQEEVLITEFTFVGMTEEQAREAALRWALDTLKGAMWDVGLRNL